MFGANEGHGIRDLLLGGGGEGWVCGFEASGGTVCVGQTMVIMSVGMFREFGDSRWKGFDYGSRFRCRKGNCCGRQAQGQGCEEGLSYAEKGKKGMTRGRHLLLR